MKQVRFFHDICTAEDIEKDVFWKSFRKYAGFSEMEPDDQDDQGSCA